MINQIFLKKSIYLHKNQIESFLYFNTFGSISKDEILKISTSIHPNKNYILQFYSECDEYCQALILVDSATQKDKGVPILGRVSFGIADDYSYKEGKLFELNKLTVAIIIRKISEDTHVKTENYIRIYIPKKELEKGRRFGYAKKLRFSI